MFSSSTTTTTAPTPPPHDGEDSAPELHRDVAEMISTDDWDEIRCRYDAFLEEGKRLHETTGKKIVEVLDVGGVSSSRALYLSPLLVEILKKGVSCDHAGAVRLTNAPMWSVSVWNAVLAAVPAVGGKTVAFC